MSGWTTWNGDRLIAETHDNVLDALDDTAEEIGAESDQQVPHDEGWLQDSKTIARHPDGSLNVQIGYGGGEQSGKPKVPYAIKWHEVPANFQKGRKHNYLRDPIKQKGPEALMRNLKKAGAKTW